MRKDIYDFQEKTKVDLEAMERRIEDKMELLQQSTKYENEKLMKEMKEFFSQTQNGGSNQSDNVFQGTHDENKRDDNVTIGFQNLDRSSPNNNDHQYCISGPRNYHIPKIGMRKFDGKDALTWICQMEHFFDLHQLLSQQKVTIASLYLEPQQFVWYQFLCDRKRVLLYLGPFLQMNQ